jgi:hypothetical protein
MFAGNRDQNKNPKTNSSAEHYTEPRGEVIRNLISLISRSSPQGCIKLPNFSLSRWERVG